VSPNPKLNYDILCAGMSAGKGDDPLHTVGTIIATGGMTESSGGIANTTFFSPSGVGGSWKAGASTENMECSRFYPTNVQEPSGSTLVLGGTDSSCLGVGTPVMEGWAGAGWSLTGGQVPHQTSLYPRVKLVPESNGEFVMAGENATSFIWDPPGGGWQQAGTMVNPGNNRSQGGVVLLPLELGAGTTTSSQVFTAGGNTLQNSLGCPQNTAEIFTPSLSQGGQGSWGTPPGNKCMCYARADHNLVLLANGTVLAVGGGDGTTGEDYSGAIPIPELYDPTTGSWTVLAGAFDGNGNAVNRTYHSTALLLPDGRVLSAGSDTFSKPPNPGTNDNTFQIFSPPYMFATRPLITAVSGNFTYGSQVTITTQDAASITTVALVRPGTTTHANDFEQRYVKLQFSINPNNQTQLLATLPANSQNAPPGFYMLFIVNGSSVPSISGGFFDLEVP
jgi:hypothetical protein